MSFCMYQMQAIVIIIMIVFGAVAVLCRQTDVPYFKFHQSRVF